MTSKIALAVLVVTFHVSAVSAQTAPPSPPQELYLAGQLGFGYDRCTKPNPILNKVSGPVVLPKNDLGNYTKINGPKGQIGISAYEWKRRIIEKYGQPSYAVGFSPSCPIRHALIYADHVPFRSYEDMSCVLSIKDRPNPVFVSMGQADARTDCASRRMTGSMMVVSIMKDGDAVIVSGGNYKRN